MDYDFKEKANAHKGKQALQKWKEGFGGDGRLDGDWSAFYSERNESAYRFADQGLLERPPQEREVSEQSQMVHAKVALPFRIIGREDVAKYVQEAKCLEEIPLHASLFCVMNVEDYWLDSPFPTLAFYEDGLIVKTNESSSTVMNRLFSAIGFRYESMRSLLNIAEGRTSHCQPYIYGDHCFLPLNGPIKRSVTWINLNHLTGYRKITKDRQKVRLDFQNRHTLDALIRYQTFEKHLHLACESYCKQHHYYFNFSKLLGYEVIRNRQIYRDSILHQRLNFHRISTPVLKGEELIKKARKVLWLDFMKAEIFRAHPYFHEINEDLERRYFARKSGKENE